MWLTYIGLLRSFGYGLPYTMATRTPHRQNILFVGVPPKDVFERLVRKDPNSNLTLIDQKRKELESELEDPDKIRSRAQRPRPPPCASPRARALGAVALFGVALVCYLAGSSTPHALDNASACISTFLYRSCVPHRSVRSSRRGAGQCGRGDGQGGGGGGGARRGGATVWRGGGRPGRGAAAGGGAP